MAKARSILADYSTYLAIRILVAILQALSFGFACALADRVAWFVRQIDRRHRQVAQENLSQAFPGRYTEAEIQALILAVYRHFCRVLIEIIHLPRMIHLHNWRQFFSYATPEEEGQALGALLSGRPVIVLTAHFGNWELSSYVMGLIGFRSVAIARPLDNPFLDRYLRRFRQATGQRILAKKGEFDQIQEVLTQAGVLCTLGDQDAGARGVFVNFLGRPASTHKAIALLALEYGATLLVLGTARTRAPMSYQVFLEDVIRAEDYRGVPEGVRLLTQRYTAGLERIVRRHPEQYFWLHRRWKHQPRAAGRRVA